MLLLLLACTKAPVDTAPAIDPPPLSDAVVDQLSMTRIKADVDLLASDAFGGRVPGSDGHLRARDALAQRMEEVGLQPLGESFIVPFATDGMRERYTTDESGQVVPAETNTGYNLVGLLPGTTRPEELIVLVSHYDHLGVDQDGEVFNGAFDDITAVAAMLELARVLTEAGIGLERSLLFLITDGEESGLLGSESWLVDPGVSTSDIVFALSADPIGRPLLPDYWPLILLGLERSPGLREDFAALAPYAEVDVAFVNRAPIIGFASDQDSFWEMDDPAPALWFTSPGMTWYHTTDDTAETIDYRGVRHQLRFLAQAMAWFGDDDGRYEELGPQDLSVADTQSGVMLLDGVLASEHPSASERDMAERLRGDFEDYIEDGELPPEANGVYLQTAIFLLFDLTAEHPGEVPPPWPDEG